MPLQCTCQQCGKPFPCYPYEAKKRKFCSKPCVEAPREGITQEDGSVLIPLTKGRFAVVDAEDAPRLLPYRWKVMAQGYAARARRLDDGPGPFYIRMHTEILGPAPEGMVCDHIDGNGFDNRKSNLRHLSTSGNSYNKGMQSNNTSGYRGVIWFKPAKLWTARIQKNRIQHSLGYFHDPVSAARAYDAAAREMFGALARLNFPE